MHGSLAAVFLLGITGPVQVTIDAHLEGPSALPEGTTVTFTAVLSVATVHGNDHIEGASLTIDGGNGQVQSVAIPHSGSRVAVGRPFTYLQDGPFTPTLAGTVGVHWREEIFFGHVDRHAVAEVSASTRIAVANVPPAIVRLTPDLEVEAGEPFAFAVDFTDPGIFDAHSVEWDLDGDGRPDFRGLAGTWSFPAAGGRRVEVVVRDDGGGEARGSFGVTVAAARARFRRGDPDGDGAVGLTDAVVILEHLFLAAPPPDCREAADVDGDGTIGLADPISILGYLFLGLAPPEPPFPGCGRGPAGGGLDCVSYPACAGGE